MKTARNTIIIGGLAAVGLTLRGRRRRDADPVHAPGHRHRGPAPEVGGSDRSGRAAADHDQPWVRTSHSDSQQRRFRR